MLGGLVLNSHTTVNIRVSLALLTRGQVSNVKLYERRVNEENPFDLLLYWFEYDAGFVSRILVVVVTAAVLIGLLKWAVH